MSPHELAARLVAHRQAAYAEPDRGVRHGLRRAFRDDVVVWAAHLQTRPDLLEGLLHLLVSEIALERQEQGLPVPPLPDLPATAGDPDVEILTPGGDHLEAIAGLDRIAAQLAAFPAWSLAVILDDGATVTVRPSRAPLTPEPTPAGVTG